jgi:hypothetical protein
MRSVPEKSKFVERRSSYIKLKIKTGFVFLHKFRLKVSAIKLLIIHCLSTIRKEVRRSWRVGADCKSVAVLLSRFESYYFHKFQLIM